MKKAIQLIGLLIISLFGLSACGPCEFEPNNEDQSIDIAIIVGAHANIPKPDFEVIEEDILEACRIGGSSVTIMVDDGQPFEVGSENIAKLKSGFTCEEYKNAAQRNKNKILDIAKQAISKEPEVDMLKALEYAVRELNTKHGKIKKIIIIDSGLSTTGVLDFTKISLETQNPEDIVEFIESKKEIPDFTKIDSIKIYGIGNVCKPQKSLSGLYREKLKAVWKGILEKGGAKESEIEIIDTMPSDDYFDESQIPTVSTVSIIDDSNGLEKDEFPDSKFPEEVIGFIKDSAELKDKEKAKEALSNVISYMQLHSDCKVLLIGTTAKVGDLQGCITLSESRALTIKHLLEESGIDGARVEIIGMGYHNPYYKREDIIEGGFDQEIAAKNRSVIIIDRSQGTAQNIIDGTWEDIFSDN